MRPETTDALTGRIRSIEAELDALQSAIAAEQLARSERQYLARCFELLHMELDAVRACIVELP
jgi:hypothetical protein